MSCARRHSTNVCPGNRVRYKAAEEVGRCVSPGHRFVLIDDQCLGMDETSEVRAIPFPERHGQYWGHPAGDQTAIRELNRLRQAGATFLVFAFTAFWWFDHYQGATAVAVSACEGTPEGD